MQLPARRLAAGGAVAAYVASIFSANWLIRHVGTTCVPDGPCLIPVGGGLMAPSGVLAVGLALAARDAVQQTAGRGASVAAILAGAGLSALLSPALALASGAAFLLSEAADYFVYQPLRRHHLPAAVLASGLVGGLVDSIVFLAIAFRSLDFLAGQAIGKAEITIVCAAVVWAVHTWTSRSRARAEARPARTDTSVGGPQ